MKKHKKVIASTIVIISLILILLCLNKTVTLTCIKEDGKKIIYTIKNDGIKKINYNNIEFDYTQVKTLRLLLDEKIDDALFANKKKSLLKKYEESLNSVCK